MTRLTITMVAIFLTLTLTAHTSSTNSFYFQTSDSTKLYVRVAGSGSPLLFVHGGPGSDSYYFEATPGNALLQQHYTMIYFDQRGSGRSDNASNGDYSLKRMLQDMEELRSHLGYQRWSVMGHSFGGILITNYAALYPQSVARLLVIHGTLNLRYSLQSHIDNGAIILGLDIQEKHALLAGATSNMEQLQRVHQKLNDNGVWYKLMYRNACEKTYNDTVSNIIRERSYEFGNKVWSYDEYWNDFTPRTRQIRCPVLVMTGLKDYAIGPDHYKDFHFPNQTVVLYAGGHAPFQEEPQWFAEKIIAFMR
ncbi:MAG: alpha/beta hydrolase [Chitinophagaceae bacterium]|nr:alpha/beta hydrolase [Chitinophagaceae bacterium]